MSKQEWKGGALLAPLPAVMVSCAREGENPNAITVAWCGIISTHPPALYISLRPSRHSYNIIKETGEFVLKLTTTSLVRAADFCGMYTGAKVDKFKRCALTPVPADEVSVPMIGECPLSLCCKVSAVQEMGSHDLFFADIVAVYADESLMDEKGKLHLERADLCAYAHGEYFSLGKRIGTFGFSAAKKKKRPQTGAKKHK